MIARTAKGTEEGTAPFFALLALAIAVAAQAGPVTGRGTEFWAVWPRSHLSLETSAEIVVMADAATMVEVDHALVFPPTLVRPGTPLVIELPESLRISANRAVVDTAFRVRSLDPLRPISVLLRVPRQAEASDDTARLIPTSECGLRYVAGSYNASLPGEPSFYVVVATEDDTLVNAECRCPFSIDNVMLDQGQAWPVTCDWLQVPNDVSGSLVTSDKPVVVLGGNSDAFIPVNYLSGDFIVEAMWPVDAWGTEFYLVPTPWGPNAASPRDVVRVIADSTGNCRFDDGTPVTIPMTARRVLERNLVAPTTITCDMPVSVYQFATGIELSDMADPLMMQIAPASQWGNGARAFLPPAYSLGNFLTVITTLANTPFVRIDGVPIPSWSGFPGSSTHAHATLPMGSGGGEHLIISDGPMTVLAHGYNDEYLPQPGLGRVPGAHGTVAAHAELVCYVIPTVDAPITGCLGSTLPLRAGPTATFGCAEVEYRWLRDGVEIPGCGFGPTGACDPVFTGDASYVLEARCVSDPLCGSVAGQLIVEDTAAAVQLFPLAASICPGDPLELDATLGFFSYQWTSDVPDVGVTPYTGPFNTRTVTPEQDTTYTVLVTDGRGCTSTASTTVTVIPDPIPPPLDATVRVTKSGSDARIAWLDLVGVPTGGYEAVRHWCSDRDWPVACPTAPPDPIRLDTAPVVGGLVAPGVEVVLDPGAVSARDLRFYRVRAMSPCLRPGPTCNPWPLQVPPCP